MCDPDCVGVGTKKHCRTLPMTVRTIAVTYTVHKDHIEAFRKAIIENTEKSLREESGCLTFYVSEGSRGSVFFLYERYIDDDAFQRHLSTPHFLEFERHSAPWVIDKKVESYVFVA